jgi:hypothetical protein
VCRRAIALAALLVAIGAAADEPDPKDPMQPFRPGAAGYAGGPTVPRFRLTAVLVSPARRVAIVNGRPYQIGERIDGAEVIRIEPQAVHLRDGDAELKIGLGTRQPERAEVEAHPSEGDSVP